jgi:hypothetical protein
MFCGENAMLVEMKVEVWANKPVVITGASEGAPHRASQPSIIMHPDNAIPTGPSRTHKTSTARVAMRRLLTASEYPVTTLWSQVSS